MAVTKTTKVNINSKDTDSTKNQKRVCDTLTVVPSTLMRTPSSSFAKAFSDNYKEGLAEFSFSIDNTYKNIQIDKMSAWVRSEVGLHYVRISNDEVYLVDFNNLDDGSYKLYVNILFNRNNTDVMDYPLDELVFTIQEPSVIPPLNSLELVGMSIANNEIISSENIGIIVSQKEQLIVYTEDISNEANSIKIENKKFHKYEEGAFIFYPAFANTGVTTLSLNSLPAKQVKCQGVELKKGYINPYSLCIAVYKVDGDFFEVKTFEDGQFADNGTKIGKAVPYVSQETSENEKIVIKKGTNAFAIGSIRIKNNSSIRVSNGSKYKIL